MSAVHKADTVNQPETIAVAMSGGVDSSAVAAMLRAEGHAVVGLCLLYTSRCV